MSSNPHESDLNLNHSVLEWKREYLFYMSYHDEVNGCHTLRPFLPCYPLDVEFKSNLSFSCRPFCLLKSLLSCPFLFFPSIFIFEFSFMSALCLDSAPPIWLLWRHRASWVMIGQLYVKKQVTCLSAHQWKLNVGLASNTYIIPMFIYVVEICLWN